MGRTNGKDSAKATAADAAKAFAACANYPAETEARKLLAETLAACCHAQHLDPYELVKRCTAASSWCPTPYDIRQMASEMCADAQKAPPGCEVCQGTGWIHSVRRVQTAAGEYDADYSGLCQCPLGRFIADGEREMRETRSRGGLA